LSVFEYIQGFQNDVNSDKLDTWKGDEKMLKELRIGKGITQTFVAGKLDISRDRMGRIENGEVTLPTEFIPVLAELYGVNFNDIIDWRVKEWKKQKKNL